MNADEESSDADATMDDVWRGSKQEQERSVQVEEWLPNLDFYLLSAPRQLLPGNGQKWGNLSAD